MELGRVRLDVQDRGSVDSVETLHCQLQAGDLQQGADRDAEVVRADRRMSGEDPGLWPCRVTPPVGGAAPNPGLPVEMEDYLDVGGLAEPVGGSLVQDRGARNSRDTTAPQWSSKIWDRPPRTTPIGVSTMGSVILTALAGCGSARGYREQVAQIAEERYAGEDRHGHGGARAAVIDE